MTVMFLVLTLILPACLYEEKKNNRSEPKFESMKIAEDHHGLELELFTQLNLKPNEGWDRETIEFNKTRCLNKVNAIKELNGERPNHYKNHFYCECYIEKVAQFDRKPEWFDEWEKKEEEEPILKHMFYDDYLNVLECTHVMQKKMKEIGLDPDKKIHELEADGIDVSKPVQEFIDDSLKD